MMEAPEKRLPRRFPFLLVFLVSVVLCAQYFFAIRGTFQIQSNLRSAKSKLHVNTKLVAERVQRHSAEEQAPSRNKQSKDESSNSAIPPEAKKPFCVPWETDLDEWWTHHPDWVVSKENETHYCFSPMEDPEKAAAFRKLYDIQFNGDCSNITTKQMWSSGFGADFQNVVDGLKNAYQTGIPTQMHVKTGAWHYAGKKDASRPVCDTKDMYCFFLKMTRCEANPAQLYEGAFMTEDFNMNDSIERWFLEYATRQQTWLRREVYKFSKKVQVKTPCTAMHVRRTDIVLHGQFSRKYRQIHEYLQALNNSTKNILLLTDDQNAIEESQVLHPDYNWMFIDRPRHRGASGGWENQIPSDDPKLEVIVLLSIFRLVRQCSSFIHTSSNFASLLKREMQDEHKDKDLHIVNLDDGNPDVFSAKNSLSVNLSTTFT